MAQLTSLTIEAKTVDKFYDLIRIYDHNIYLYLKTFIHKE